MTLEETLVQQFDKHLRAAAETLRMMQSQLGELAEDEAFHLESAWDSLGMARRDVWEFQVKRMPPSHGTASAEAFAGMKNSSDWKG